MTTLPAPADGSTLEQVRAQHPDAVAVDGLAAAFKPAGSWGDGHLTYATSPTTGCGPEALCVPAPVAVEKSRDVRDAAVACHPSSDATGVVSLQDVVVTATLPAPIHQFGLGGGGRWGSAPPGLISGRQQIRFGVMDLLSGDDMAVVAAGGLTSSGKPAPITIDDALSGIRYDGVTWARC